MTDHTGATVVMAKLFVVAFSSVVVVATTIAQEVTSLTNSITLATAVATIIAALFVGVVNVIAARAAARKEIAPVMDKVSRIEAHVNSEKTRDQGIIATQKQQIELQREVIDELKKAAALLAQAKSAIELTQAVSQAAVAGATTPSRTQPAAVAAATAPVLARIEENTKETAINTATDKATPRTDALSKKKA